MRSIGPVLVTPGATAMTLALGFVLGLRHATEADHVVAVSTLVTERRSLAAAAGVGVLWGVGHTIALIAAGVIVLIAQVPIPGAVAEWLELAVAAMIVLLGARLLVASRAPDAPAGAPRVQGRIVLSRWQPLAVGMMHGLAGSAALIVLVEAEIARHASAPLGLAYLALFGVGSIGGMLLMGLAIGAPFALGEWRRLSLATVRKFAGAGSVLFGLWYGWQAL